MSHERDKHWLYRSKRLPTLWKILMGVLLLALLPEFFMHHHPHFEAQGLHIDASWGFFAWYGFLSCAVMVFVGKVLGVFLKRKDSYYDE